MRTVQSILENKSKPFNQVDPNTMVIDALNLLNSLNLSYLVVMSGNDYKGIFSERDYSRNVILKGRRSNTTRVSEVMTTDVPIVALTDTVENCMRLMNVHKTRYLLAMDNAGFHGVITIHDLLRQLINKKETGMDSPISEPPPAK